MQQIVVLLAFLISLSLHERDLPTARPWLTAVAIGVYLLITAGLTMAGARTTSRRLANSDDSAGRAIRTHNLLKLLIQVWLLAGLTLVVLTGYGQWCRAVLLAEKLPLLAKLASLAPFAAGLLLYWLADWPFHRTMYRLIAARSEQPVRRPVTLRAYLSFHLRHHLLFIAVPVSLMVLIWDVLQLYVSQHLPETPTGDAIFAGGMLAATGMVFFFAPAIIIRIWRTSSLPAGPFRSQLEHTSSRLGLGFRDISIWHSGHMVANAGVMGLAKPVRYILLSDVLLENMPDEQVQAIFAHEAGHILSRHIFYMAVFAGTAGLAALVVAETARATSAANSWAAEMLALGAIGCAWVFGFGWLSRWLERQSDVTAAWASGPDDADGDRITHQGAAVFAAALQRVAALNGIPITQRSWRHGSIFSRVNYVFYLANTGGRLGDVNRTVGRIKQGLWAAMLVSAAALIAVTAMISNSG